LLLTPLSDVTSVNGKTGVVTIAKADIGLSNVTNESKATMFTNSALTGNPTAPTQAQTVANTTIATTQFVKTAVDNKTLITVSATAPTSPNNKDLWYEIV